MIFKTILIILFGAVLFIGWHFFVGLYWNREASLDIVSGAIIEFYLFTYIISQSEKREETKRANEMDAHLKKIEMLIKKANIKLDEKGD